MGTVQVLDATRMLALEASTVVSGHLSGDNLILVQHDGTEINLGSLRGPAGINATAGARWSNTTAYVIGNTVGFAGRVWACIQPNTGKPPNFWAAYWVPVNGASVDAWAQSDPYFFRDTLDDWETFWVSGTVTRAYSTTAGEFETGEKSLKLTLNASSTQRLYEKAYNVVQGGEKVQIQVRAKLTAAAAGVTINAELLQSPSTGSPVPFGSGVVSAPSDIGAQTLTTTWTTFTFTMTCLNNKPLSTANVMISTGAGASAVVVMDSIKVTRGTGVLNSARLTVAESRLDYHDGLIKGVEMPANDLNTVTTPGLYLQSQNTDAAAGTNYPVPLAGTLEVFIGLNNLVWQRYTPYSSNSKFFYVRSTSTTPTWSPWYRYSSDNADPGAVMSQFDGTTSPVGTTSTTPVGIAGGASGTFVAPFSGAAMIGIGGYLKCSVAGTYAHVVWQWTSASNSIIPTSGNTAQEAFSTQDTGYTKGTYQTLVTGLVPGVTYGIRAAVFSGATTSTASIASSRITVIPQ